MASQNEAKGDRPPSRLTSEGWKQHGGKGGTLRATIEPKTGFSGAVIGGHSDGGGVSENLCKL